MNSIQFFTGTKHQEITLEMDNVIIQIVNYTNELYLSKVYNHVGLVEVLQPVGGQGHKGPH